MFAPDINVQEIVMRFEWDREKAKKNLKKHKVSFDEAMTVFK